MYMRRRHKMKAKASFAHCILCGDDERTIPKFVGISPIFSYNASEMYSFLRTYCSHFIIGQTKVRMKYENKVMHNDSTSIRSPISNINTYHAIGNSFTRTQSTQHYQKYFRWFRIRKNARKKSEIKKEMEKSFPLCTALCA